MDCFVIMPFGEKKDPRGKPIDYDRVFEDLIAPAAEDCGLNPVRCDKIPGSGSIPEKMFKSIQAADVAIVDVSYDNANVFYELGVRHALKRSVTILIKNQDYSLPFNITTLDVIDYRVDGGAVDEAAKAKIIDYIQKGLKDRNVDSPVFDHLDHDVRSKTAPIRPNRARNYRVKSDEGRVIELHGGDLKNINDFDVWVNSENRHMEMARHHDRSVSSIVRFLGARRDRFDRVQEDLVYDALRQEHEAQFGRFGEVPATQCLDTIPGQLADTHNVKRVIHAAAVEGHNDHGYKPVQPLENCVWNALQRASELQLEQQVQSVLLPFFGTGVGQHQLDRIARLFVSSALEFLRQNKGCPLNRIGFITLTEADYQICQTIFDRHPNLVAA